MAARVLDRGIVGKPREAGRMLLAYTTSVATRAAGETPYLPSLTQFFSDVVLVRISVLDGEGLRGYNPISGRCDG